MLTAKCISSGWHLQVFHECFFSPVQLSALSRKYFKANTAHLLDRRLSTFLKYF